MSSLILNVLYNYKALHYTLFSIICCFIFFGSDHLARSFVLEHAQYMTFHLLCESQPQIHTEFHGADMVLISGFCRSAHEVLCSSGMLCKLIGSLLPTFGTTCQSHRQGSSTKTPENENDRLSRKVSN